MPGRLLRLLSLLQDRREWSGAELAERLGVTDRTVRRDIERLRALDYHVDGVTGTAGGYRLASGQRLPPLLLDDEEAVATALALVSAAGTSAAGLEESAMRALAKLRRMLPARLRPRLASLGGAVTAVGHRDAPRVDPDVVALLASYCHEERLVAFDYRDRSGEGSTRRVEPHGLVTVRGRWYLVGYDPGRADWRTFRLDRIADPSPSTRRFRPRELPAPDAASYLARSFASASYRHTALVTVGISAAEVRERLFFPMPWEVEDHDTGGCTVRVSAESAELVVRYVAALATLDTEFTLDAPDEITRRVREVGRRLAG
ncbi:YafY family transcriptional regulator [Halostreptopolyspora alba]|uniref:YafY family transcriptional regulator n=2 Tax=Halostreptopolyspora alba TaxID=2487137 RepID=A0A3N0E9R8_9ACTN|nr:YafY family transcriptional regulator [Nocardiopsaceae bacterium YIM 96095]